MKKTLVCLFTVLIAVFMALPAQAAQDKKAKDPVVKVGVIDMQRIMRESKAAKAAQDLFRKDLDAKRPNFPPNL
jgi:Skp family chaperone for outer membrane proteins